MAEPLGNPATATRGGGREWSPWPAILLATLVGGVVRAAPVLMAGFPVNDGGLFASFVDAILVGPGLLPDSITYNDLNAPFAYPPLAFLAAAGLERVLPIGTVEWLRWIPLAASIATIPAFFLLARELTPTKVHAVIAAFVFALVPRSFEWLVMGGGLTRAPAFLLAILSIWMGIRYLKTGGRAWLGAGIALGLATLTHPEGGLFATLGLTLLALAHARGRRAWTRMIGAAAVAVVITLPWILTVIASHGTAPFVSAGGTSANLLQSLYLLLTMRLTDEPILMLAAGLAALGFVYSLSARRYFVPAWALATVIAGTRAAATFVSLPLAILAAIGLLDVVVARVIRIAGDIDSAPGWPAAVLRSRPVAIILGVALEIALLSALLAPYLLGSMASLSADARAAMAWAQGSLPESARVVIVTGRVWTEDATSEWFPYLSGRRSIATVQGYEWMGEPAWRAQLEMSSALQGHATDTVAALDEWARQFGAEFDYVYVPKGRLGAVTSGPECCAALRETLRGSGAYEIVYDGPGATIARRRSSP